jgi:leucyl aminopeptidase
MPLALIARVAAPASLDTPLLIVARRRGMPLDDSMLELDKATGGALARTLERGDFRGDRDELLHLAGGSTGPARLLLVGMGDAKDLPAAIRRAASLAARQARKLGVAMFAWWHGSDLPDAAERAAAGLLLGSWEYNELRTPPPASEQRPEPSEALLLTADEDGVAAGVAIGEGINLARRLGNMPGNVCTPELLAETAREISARYGMAVSVLGRSEMEREGFGALLAVAQGTPQDPKLITLEYRKGGSTKPIVLVGKGLCFDSGGVSIKPAQGMELMKFDMSGAGGVLGAMEAIGRLQLPVNVVALIGSTTNMISGVAVKPGDVVRSHLGKTIEVINTDAEGRMVLADVLSWARRYDPAVVLDAATLTGAVVIALGHTALGVFSDDEKLTTEILDAGRRAGEPGWPLPLWDEFRELIKSDVADIKNAGGRAAGAISAAMFLKEFTESYPWAHLDVAGTAYSETDLGHLPKGSTGIPVGLFVEFVRGRVARA